MCNGVFSPKMTEPVETEYLDAILKKGEFHREYLNDIIPYKNTFLVQIRLSEKKSFLSLF